MQDTLTITDNRTGNKYDVPIMYGTYQTYGAAIRAADLRQTKVADDDFGLLSYDPGFTNTASCKSAIDPAHGWLARAMARNVRRFRPKDCETKTSLYWQ